MMPFRPIARLRMVNLERYMRLVSSSAVGIWLLIILASSVMSRAAAQTGTFPQLIATRYGLNAPLPAGAEPLSLPAVSIKTGKLPVGTVVLSSAAAANGAAWIVTDRGVYRSEGDGYVALHAPAVSRGTHLQIPIDVKVNAVTADSEGHIWAATSSGVYISDGADWWQHIDRSDGMPFDYVISLCLAPNGDVWGGTTEGAWRLRDGRFRYFHGKRWLPGDVVSAIWSDAKGRIWLRTDGGVSCIEERMITLAEKAAHFNRITQERHNRRGYIGHIHLTVPGDPTRPAHYEAADSDGLWTSYYVAAMALRYAATHDPEAKRQAQRSMNALLELERLSGIPGYPARCTVTEQEIRDGIVGFNPEATVKVPGETDKYWVRSPVEKGVWLKTDTSSDTMDGHYFAWYLYSEHVADAAEKAKIAALIRRATDSIMRHDYTLIGHTGRKTRWGVWGPQYLNDDPEWFEQRGINSMEILSHLKLTAYLTHDAKYDRAYEELIRKHHYLQNTLLLRRGRLSDWWYVNHSDDQLTYIAFYPLMMLEKDPARRRILVQSLARTWEDSPTGEQTLRAEHSSFYNLAYGAMTGNPCAPDEAIADLEDWPWDMVDWTVVNSRRHDVQVRQRPGRDYDNLNDLNRVLPASERFLKRWNGNPWTADGGSDGKLEHDGSTWLIGYWLGVYHGYLPSPKAANVR